MMPLAHVAGVPVEELFQPLAIAALCAGAWVSTRVRRHRSAEPHPRRVDARKVRAR
jgi:hypothetical protein